MGSACPPAVPCRPCGRVLTWQGLAKKLFAWGIPLIRSVVVPDDVGDIAATVRDLEERNTRLQHHLSQFAHMRTCAQLVHVHATMQQNFHLDRIGAWSYVNMAKPFVRHELRFAAVG